MSASRAHGDVDLLYPADGFAAVDRVIRAWRLEEIAAKRMEHKRAFVVDGTMVEIVLVRQDSRGYFTSYWGRVRHEWPADVFSSLQDVRVASAAALGGYRAGYVALRGSPSTAALSSSVQSTGPPTRLETPMRPDR